MCSLCDSLDRSDAGAADRLKQLGEALTQARDKKSEIHLQKQIDVVIDGLVPMAETNTAVEEDWWRANHETED